jgi:NADPH:quinone reductase
MKSKAILVNQTGGPEVLHYSEVEVPAPGTGEALVRHRALGDRNTIGSSVLMP